MRKMEISKNKYFETLSTFRKFTSRARFRARAVEMIQSMIRMCIVVEERYRIVIV